MTDESGLQKKVLHFERRRNELLLRLEDAYDDIHGRDVEIETLRAETQELRKLVEGQMRMIEELRSGEER